jgi:hypothetical protein
VQQSRRLYDWDVLGVYSIDDGPDCCAPGATVPATANWLMKNPTAGLMTTAPSSVADDPAIDSTIVGFIPKPGAQEGIVFTIAKSADGVAVRAEIAALTESATCQPLPDGGMWGPPGQG